MRGPHVRFCERDKAGTDHSGLTLLDTIDISNDYNCFMLASVFNLKASDKLFV